MLTPVSISQVEFTGSLALFSGFTVKKVSQFWAMQ